MVGNILVSKWAGLQKTLNAGCKNKATLHVLQQPARPGVAMKALKAPLQEGFFAILGKSFPFCHISANFPSITECKTSIHLCV